MIAKQVGQSQKISMTKHREGELDSFPLTACFNSVAKPPWGAPANFCIALYNEWAGYAASAGTYEVRGNTIINHNVVAKMVRGMTLTEEAIISKFDGNNFVARGKPGNPNSDRETTYTRIQ